MTTFYLVRHAEKASDPDILTGRSEGIRLTERGRQQAAQLGAKLAPVGLSQIWSSPMERARETAAAIGQATGLKVEIAEGLTELDVGRWTGRRCSELAGDAEWERFNGFRSCTRIPGGELFSEVQTRVVAEMLRIRAAAGDAAVALVSHGDPIKAALMHVLAMPLDHWARIEVGIASISVVEWGGDFARVVRLNDELDDRK